MLAIVFCPHCGEQATIDDRLLGKETMCPACQRIFPTEAPKEPEPSPPTPTKPVDAKPWPPKAKAKPAPPTPAPPPAPVHDPFAFEEGSERNDRYDDEDDRDRPRRRSEPKKASPIAMVLVMAGLIVIVVPIVIVTKFASDDAKKDAQGGFSMKSALIAGVGGGVLAGGIAVARMLLGTDKKNTKYGANTTRNDDNRARDRRRRDDDDDRDRGRPKKKKKGDGSSGGPQDDFDFS